jgi:hypothetical protein
MGGPTFQMPTYQQQQQTYTPAPVSSGLDDLLGLGSDSLVKFLKFFETLKFFQNS